MTGAPPAAIREATVADVHEILACWKVAAEGESVTDDAEGVSRLIAHDPHALLVAELGGVIAGTVIAAWDGWRGHCYRLAVLPEHRRRGIGLTLLRAADERFAAAGARKVDAMVLGGNTVAQEVWRAAGFAPHGEWRRWVKPVAEG